MLWFVTWDAEPILHCSVWRSHWIDALYLVCLFFSDLEIICPSDINMYVNRSNNTPFKKVPWKEPQVINRKNGTKFSVEVSPTWAVPPVNVNTSEAVYVITYVVTHEFGQSARCSFNLTVSYISCEFSHSFWCILISECGTFGRSVFGILCT